MTAETVPNRWGKGATLGHCGVDLLPGGNPAVNGNSGTAKSTAIKAVSCGVKPYAGNIRLAGPAPGAPA